MTQLHERLADTKKIVAFCGKKRTGKDTAGNALRNYETDSLASPIKDVVQTVFQFSDEQVYTELKSAEDDFWDFSPRWAMQRVGTELFREGIDSDVWIKSLLVRMDKSPHGHFAITDVRFPNEVEHLKKAGAEIVYIQRPSVEPTLNTWKEKIARRPYLKSLLSPFVEFGPEYHMSEIALDNHPVTDEPDIVNDSTVEAFEKAVNTYVDETMNKGNSFGSPLKSSSFS